MAGNITPPKNSVRKTPRKKRKSTLGRYASRGKASKIARSSIDRNSPSGGQTSITQKPRSISPTPRSISSKKLSKEELAKQLASSRWESLWTKRKLEISRAAGASISRKKDRLDVRRIKDKETISSLGALLSDSRKFGKKASSELATKDKEREVSIVFVHLFSVVSYEY